MGEKPAPLFHELVPEASMSAVCTKVADHADVFSEIHSRFARFAIWYGSVVVPEPAPAKVGVVVKLTALP